MPNNLVLSQGPLSGVNGTEINLWVLPYYNFANIAPNGSASALFMTISTDLKFSILFNATNNSLCFTMT